MKKWFLLLLEALANLFRWRAQATDPLVEYRQVHDEWEVEGKRLERVRDEARQTYINHCLIGKRDDGKLFGAWKQTADAIHSHRAREPKRENYRAE